MREKNVFLFFMGVICGAWGFKFYLDWKAGQEK
jgi:hypothetical protein